MFFNPFSAVRHMPSNCLVSANVFKQRSTTGVGYKMTRLLVFVQSRRSKLAGILLFLGKLIVGVHVFTGPERSSLFVCDVCTAGFILVVFLRWPFCDVCTAGFILVVFLRWPFCGTLVEVAGAFQLFKAFIPQAINSLRSFEWGSSPLVAIATRFHSFKYRSYMIGNIFIWFMNSRGRGSV